MAGGEIQAVIGARFAIAAARLGAEVDGRRHGGTRAGWPQARRAAPNPRGRGRGPGRRARAARRRSSRRSRPRRRWPTGAQEAALDRLAGAVTALAAQVDAAAARARWPGDGPLPASRAPRRRSRPSSDTVGLTLAEFLAGSSAGQRGADAGPGPAVQLSRWHPTILPPGILTWIF